MKTTVEAGSFSRTVSLRIGPNEDLTEAIEQACHDHGLTHAIVRSGIGSLIDAELEVAPDRPPIEVRGLAVELLTLVGEVRPAADGAVRARLSGSVGDPTGRVFGGRFVRGANRACVTLEVILQEWIPASAA